MEKELAVLLNRQTAQAGICDFLLHAPAISKTVTAGQFVHIFVPGHILRRPISVCEADSQKETIRIVFQVRGAGTDQLAQCQVGETLNLLGPLGKGFPLLEKERRVFLVGGGIGVPPLLSLGRYYGENAQVFLGFRTRKMMILKEDFLRYGSTVEVATEDGTFGKKGYVSDLFEKAKQIDCIYACGPTAMLHAVSRFAAEAEIPCYVSLEERMACGVGACLGCAISLTDQEENRYYGHVCKDGPVFDHRQVTAFRERMNGVHSRNEIVRNEGRIG